MVSLNVTGAAHYVVMPTNTSLPTVVDSQALTTQATSVLFQGNIIAASGEMNIPAPFTNYSQVVLVRPLSLHSFGTISFPITFALACGLLCDALSTQSTMW